MLMVMIAACIAYRVAMVDTDIDTVYLENLAVVREFPDVFPEGFLGLPPIREIEFSIDLLSRMMLVSKAPYRMDHRSRGASYPIPGTTNLPTFGCQSRTLPNGPTWLSSKSPSS